MPKRMGDRPLLWIVLAIAVALSPLALIAFCLAEGCGFVGGREKEILLAPVVVPALVIVAAFVAFLIWGKSWLGRLLEFGTLAVLLLGLALIGSCVSAAGFPGGGVAAIAIWIAVLGGVVLLIRLLRARGKSSER